MKDIKTTLTGLFLALLVAVQPLTTVDGFDIKKDWLQVLIAIGIATLGFFTKDSNKNG